MTTGISRPTLRDWRDHPTKALQSRASCPRCASRPAAPEPQADYAYLLGLYLGDGCISVGGDPAKGVRKRGLNRVRRPLADGEHWYEYPRYLFVNKSTDILGLCGETLDRLGVAWRFSKPTTISVAKRDAVARLDEFVGPKY